MVFTTRSFAPVQIDPAIYQQHGAAVLSLASASQMVGLLEQLGQISQYAAEIFKNVFNDVASLAERITGVKERTEYLESSLGSVANTLHQVRPGDFYENQLDNNWHQSTDMNHLIFSTDNRPAAVARLWNEALPPPNVELMNDIAGRDCLKLYTDPHFFLRQWFAEDEKMREVRGQTKRRNKVRKVRKNPADAAAQMTGIQVKVFSGMGEEFGGASVQNIAVSPTAVDASNQGFKVQNLTRHHETRATSTSVATSPSTATSSSSTGSPEAIGRRQSVLGRPPPPPTIAAEEIGGTVSSTTPKPQVSKVVNDDDSLQSHVSSLPPPPPPSAPTTGETGQLDSIFNSEASRLKALLPPPPPPSTGGSLPPPPPSSSSATSSALPPPPPASTSTGGASLPPPPPSTSKAGALPPPPPPSSGGSSSGSRVASSDLLLAASKLKSQSASAAEPALDPRESMLKQITQGITLRARSKIPEPVVTPEDARGGLLSDIRNMNFTLKSAKKAETAPAPSQPTVTSTMSAVMGILARRRAIQDSDSEDEWK